MDIRGTLKEKLEHENLHLTDEESMQMSRVLREFSFVHEDSPVKKLDDRIASFYAKYLDVKLAEILSSKEEHQYLSCTDFSETQKREYIDSRILRSYSETQKHDSNLEVLEKRLKKSDEMRNDSFALMSLELPNEVGEGIIEDWINGDCYNLHNPIERPYMTYPSVWIYRDRQNVDIGEDNVRHCISLEREEWNELHQMVKKGKSPQKIRDYIDSLVYEEEMDWSGGPHLDISHIKNLIIGIKAGKLKPFQ